LPGGAQPAPRWLTSAVFDADHRRLIVYGGLAGSEIMGDAWILDLLPSPRWSRVDAIGPAPAPRFAHGATFDRLGNALIVFGGTTATGKSNECWALRLDDPAHWEPVVPIGPAPPPREHTVALYDPARHRVIVLGGVGSYEALHDVWTLQLGDMPRWELLLAVGAIMTVPARAILDEGGDRLILGTTPLKALDLGATSPAWQPLSTENDPPGRWNGAIAWDENHGRLLLFGGTLAYGTHFNDLWSLQLREGVVSVDPHSPSASTGIAVSPNPAAGIARIALNNPVSQRLRLSVIDLQGRAVRSLVDGERWAGQVVVHWDGRMENGLSAPAGVYWIVAEQGGRSRHARFVRLR
jgi:hypothetical protein